MDLYFQKLDALRDYLFEKIDGVITIPLEERFEKITISHQLAEINKKNERANQSEIVITDHAYERAKERLGMAATSFTNLAVKAYTHGVSQSSFCGNLKKYVDKLFLEKRTANNIKIYGENIFLFRFNRLLTVYQIPTNLRKAAIKSQKNPVK